MLTKAVPASWLSTDPCNAVAASESPLGVFEHAKSAAMQWLRLVPGHCHAQIYRTIPYIMVFNTTTPLFPSLIDLPAHTHPFAVESSRKCGVEFYYQMR